MKNSSMSVDDALRIAQIFEADDIISVPAMACRVLRLEILTLREQAKEEHQDVQNITKRK